MKKSKTIKIFIAALTIVLALPTLASAHCDTMDGPTVGDAKKAIENNNVNYVLPQKMNKRYHRYLNKP